MKPTNTNTQQIERDIAGEGMASEQAADLAALQASAEQGAAMPVQMAEPEPEGPDLAAEIQGILTIVVQTLGPMFPSLPEIYTEPTKTAVGGAVAAVCNKRGWLQGGMFGEYGEEIACLAVCGPLALATYKGVQGDLAKHKAKADAKAGRIELDKPADWPEAPTVAPSKTVTFGAPQPAEATA